ncbi:MAG: UDP-glucose/GDP-mannose dehydrogenase family protein [Deinococcales bacterium]
MNVVIVGAGYVGLTTGATLAYVGHEVLCIDKNPAVVQRLRERRPTFHEPGLPELLAATGPRLSASERLPELCGEHVVILAVGTPQRDDGDADLVFVDTAARDIAARVAPGARLLVVNKSTVPLGSARHVRALLERTLVERGVDGGVRVASNPEFLAEGQAVHDSLYPDRIVIGADDAAAVATLRELYAPILEQTFTPPPATPRPERYALPPLITTTPTSAELTKYAANAFLATKISFINEFAGLAERVGADITEVARAIGLDSRIGPKYLQAGAGWGGSCFGKDTSAILAAGAGYDYPMAIVRAAVEVNRRQRLHIVERLQEHLKVLRGATIGLLGVAFKSQTDDIRDAPALGVIERLLALGATVRVHDPIALPNLKRCCTELEVDACDDPVALATGCDALVLVTDWPEYRSLPLAELRARMRGDLFVDGRNLLPPDEVRAAGLTYAGIGR